jgi:hypothetical protein
MRESGQCDRSWTSHRKTNVLRFSNAAAKLKFHGKRSPKGFSQRTESTPVQGVISLVRWEVQGTL